MISEEDDIKVLNINVEEKPAGEVFGSAGTGTDGTTIGGGVVENNFLGKNTYETPRSSRRPGGS